MEDSNLHSRPLLPSDYDEILVKWWENWKWEAPVRDFLPENGTGGLMIMDGEEPVCAGFIYITNSKVAWCDWIISSDTYRKESRKKAIEMLVEELADICRNTGYRYSYALIRSEPLIETYKNLDYTQAETYTTEMIKVL